MKKAFRIDKIEKFLLCENPLRNEQENLNRQFIFHTREPAMLIQIHWMNDLSGEHVDLTSADICNVSTTIEDENGNEEELIFRTIFLFDENYTREQITPIVKRAIDWYLTYLSKE